VLPRLDISRNTVRWTGFAAGPLLGGLTLLLLPDVYRDAAGHAVEFDHAGHASAALAVWMAVWWMTEALPVYATALLPLVVLPIGGALPIRQAAAPYAHELIFLFMGGFVVALSMERWGLHRRIALAALRGGATTPRIVVGRFMLVTAGLSMWVSNTATTLMMLPIAVSVIELLTRPDDEGADPGSEPLASCLLLGIAYGASIGGIGTLIGTPPNLFLASFVTNELGIEIGFARWMLIGVPLVAVFLPLARLLLTRVLFPIGRERIEGIEEHIAFKRASQGPMSRGERTTLAVFAAMAAAWICRPVLVKLGATGLSDAGIAIAAALALFAIPVNARKREFTMDWETAVRLPWGVLILFGGGLSLAAAIRSNGVGEFLGAQVGAMSSVPAHHRDRRRGARHLPDRAHEQHRHHRDPAPHPRGTRPGPGIAPPPAPRTRRDRGELCLHAPRRDPTERRRVQLGPRPHARDDPRRPVAQHPGHRPDPHPRLPGGAPGPGHRRLDSHPALRRGRPATRRVRRTAIVSRRRKRRIRETGR
jgi:sodium-dependent dicarboxylate transporter 2/3/5